MFKFNLLPNEKIVKFFRQSESVLFKPVLIIFLLIYLPWYFLIKYDLVSDYTRLLLFWTLLVLAYGVNKYVLWLINIALLTDKRIISINYRNMFNKKVLEAPLERVLNVSFSRHGFLQTIFGVGSVEIQVAGLPEPMLLKFLSRPEKAKDLLWQNLPTHPDGATDLKMEEEIKGQRNFNSNQLVVKRFGQKKRVI